MLPFHAKEATEILKNCKRTIGVEANETGQFARLLRAETGHGVTDQILKYDGEPFEPGTIAKQVRGILKGEKVSLDVNLAEAREIAYHHVRVYMHEEARPGKITKVDGNGFGEPVWQIEIVHRDSGEKQGELQVGVETGSTYTWQPVH